MTETATLYKTIPEVHGNYRPVNIISLDPGMNGAIAILKNNTITAQPFPVSGKTLDLAALAEIIRGATPSMAVIEKVHSMPGQGVSSTFKFGQGYGALLGIVAALNIPTELTTPQRWKGAILTGTAKDKDAAIAYCRRAFPDVPLIMPGCRKVHDGVADALILRGMGRSLFVRSTVNILTLIYLNCQYINVRTFALVFWYEYFMGDIPMSKVAELRKRAGLTQRQLADLVGVTESTIRNLENNRNGIEQMERFAKLCKALNCSPSDLFEYQSLGQEEVA